MVSQTQHFFGNRQETERTQPFAGVFLADFSKVDPVATDLRDGPLATFAKRSQTVGGRVVPVFPAKSADMVRKSWTSYHG